MGKALLAWLPVDPRRQLLEARPLVALTPNTITDLDQLEAELARVRERGFAINDEEMAFGLRSTAAAIRNHDGWPVAALNAAVATARVSRAELEHRVAPRVAQCAAAISAQLGFSPSPTSTLPVASGTSAWPSRSGSRA